MGVKRSLGLPAPLAALCYPLTLSYRVLTSCFDSAMATYPGQLVGRYVGNVSSVLAKCVILWMVSTILLISSAVLYFTFHYSMMPTMLVTLPVHLQFSPCYGPPKDCSYPTADVYLVDSNGSPLLHPHVHYTMSLEMDMPESVPNKDAGMFMVQMNLTSVSGKLVGSSSRANILHYRSGLHRALRTLFFSPLLLTEYTHEQQRITTELFSSYLVHEEEPPTRCRLAVRSLSVQVYSARLRVHARLSGLRRLMYHHPLVMGVLGTAATFTSLAFVFLLVWLRTTELPTQLTSRLKRVRLLRPAEASAAGSDNTADAKPDSTAPPLKDKSTEEYKGQESDDEAPTVVPISAGAAACEQPSETLGSDDRRQMPLPGAGPGDVASETDGVLGPRQRVGHSTVEY